MVGSAESLNQKMYYITVLQIADYLQTMTKDALIIDELLYLLSEFSQVHELICLNREHSVLELPVTTLIRLPSRHMNPHYPEIIRVSGSLRTKKQVLSVRELYYCYYIYAANLGRTNGNMFLLGEKKLRIIRERSMPCMVLHQQET